jgi:hypothetical protein
MGELIDHDGMLLAGPLASHPEANAFAEVIRGVHHRYATEVVGFFKLCPHMKDPQTAFGRFCVILEREANVDTAVQVALEVRESVAHLIYPLVEGEAAPFERFGNALHEALRKRMRAAPVHATFHPRMEGDTSNASRLVGFVRRAPDPFVQFVPEGLHEGGTQFIDPSSFDPSTFVLKPDNAKSLYERLGSEDLERIEATIRELRAERDERYAPFLQAIAA